MQLVRPKVYLVGYTVADTDGLLEFLRQTKQEEFWHEWQEAIASGIPAGEALCSVFAKLCYRSLVLGKNCNVKKIRPIRENIVACLASGHGSVFEHCQLNFVVNNCSRVYTHEQVRHRAGFAYSQTSGRYCALQELEFVWDDLLDPAKDLVLGFLQQTEETLYLLACRLGLFAPPYGLSPQECKPSYSEKELSEVVALLQKVRSRLEPQAEQLLAEFLDADGCLKPCGSPDAISKLCRLLRWQDNPALPFTKKKELTSVVRRLAPNGQANDIAVSCNLRALRHTVQMRTSRHSEREIRDIWGQIYQITSQKFPLLFSDAKVTIYEGLPEVSGMKLQPYDTVAQ